jgi:hypothetical protein
MPGQFKKMWKRVGNQWLRTHVTWLRAGDVFQVDGDSMAYMANSDPRYGKHGIPTVSRVEAKLPDEHKHHS